jgi:dihydropyrimidinase
MAEFDLVVRGGTVVTASETMRADVGIRAGRMVALAESLPPEGRVIDAGGLLVMPGGVDTHCHIEQLEANGTVHEESFVTASASAFAGGTTSAICFASQFRGHPIGPTLDDYRRRASAAMIDYAFHQIITDPTDEVVEKELPAIVAAGIRSFKIFMTYDPLHVDDAAMLRVLAAAKRLGTMVAVHCENYAAIKFMTEALLRAGLTAPKYHRWSSARRPAAPSRSPSLSTRPSRCSTSPARKWRRRSRAQKRAASRYGERPARNISPSPQMTWTGGASRARSSSAARAPAGRRSTRGCGP